MRLPQSSSRHLSILSVFVVITLVAVLLPSGAQAATQQLTCSPSSLRFGKVPIGQSETQSVTLSNSGEGSVTISAINVAVSEFSITGLSLPATLGPGQSVTANVVFTPTVIEWTGGTATFTSTASNSRMQISLAGNGVGNQPMTASPSSLSFGSVAVGTSSQLSVVLTNAESWKETISSFQTSGAGFTVIASPMPMTLSAGQSTTLTISFTPQSVGLANGSVFIAGPGLNIPFSGTGTAIGQLTVSPTALNFGNVNLGSTGTQISTLTAAGGTVTISAASASNSEFGISGASFPLTLSPGQSVQFNVNFSPTKSGAASATLSVASNASSTQSSESLSGTGVTPQYSVSLSWSPSTSSVAGYNVYRGTAVGSYSKINTSIDSTTAFTDGTVASGVTYYYAATAVSSSGQESSYSTPIEVSVP